jgi:hypothetical protein
MQCDETDDVSGECQDMCRYTRTRMGRLADNATRYTMIRHSQEGLYTLGGRPVPKAQSLVRRPTITPAAPFP